MLSQISFPLTSDDRTLTIEHIGDSIRNGVGIVESCKLFPEIEEWKQARWQNELVTDWLRMKNLVGVYFEGRRHA